MRAEYGSGSGGSGAAPRKAAQASEPMTGVQYLKAIARGDISVPYLTDAGIGFRVFTKGIVTLEMPVEERHLNHCGTCNGGIISALADTGAGAAACSMWDCISPFSTLTLSVDFENAARSGDVLTVTGFASPSNAKSRHPSATAVVKNQDGYVIATATARFLVKRGETTKPGRGEGPPDHGLIMQAP